MFEILHSLQNTHKKHVFCGVVALIWAEETVENSFNTSNFIAKGNFKHLDLEVGFCSKRNQDQRAKIREIDDAIKSTIGCFLKCD